MRGGWRPLPGLICDCFNLVGQGNFIFVGEKSGNFKILWLWQPCNMYLIPYNYLNNSFYFYYYYFVIIIIIKGQEW